MSDSDDGPPRKIKRKVSKSNFDSDTESGDGFCEQTQSLRLRNKKTFKLPSRKKAFASMTGESTSPVKISALKPRNREFNLVKERSAYNQRDGYSTDGSAEGEMDKFIDDADVSTDDDSSSDSDVDGEDRKSTRHCSSKSARRSSRPVKQRTPDIETPPPTASDCDSQNYDISEHLSESDDENETLIKRKKKKNLFESDSSDEDEPDEAEMPAKLKPGRRRGNVVGSDESDDESIASWSGEDVVVLDTGKESASDSSVTSLTSDACSGSEDNIKTRAAQNAKSRRKKSNKTLKKQLAKLQERKKAREESKKSRDLNALDPAPLFSPTRFDDDVSIVDSGGESDHQMENLPVDDFVEDSDLVLVSHKSFNVCPITKKPFTDAVVNTTCGHKYERTALNELMKQSVVKGKDETRCPVVGCNRFVPAGLNIHC